MRCFIKGFAKITVPLYDLTSGENKDKKSEPVTLTPETQKLSEEERQKALMEKLDLSGLAGWTGDLATKARNLLMEYHDLFSLEKSKIGQTKMVKHTIMLKDPDATPFKEWFH